MLPATGTLVICLLLLCSHSTAQFTTDPPTDDSLQCSGAGMLMFEGDGRFSIVRDSDNAGGLACQGDIRFVANSTLYTRIVSDGRFVCNSSSSVRLCGYGEAGLITSDRSSSMLQCNGEPLFPRVINSTNTFCVGNSEFSVQGSGNYSVNAAAVLCTGNVTMVSLTAYYTAGDFSCIGSGPYTISGYGELFSVSAESGNCTISTDYCTLSGEYSIGGEGAYNVSTQSGNILCFGDVTSFGSYTETSGPFFCEGRDTVILNGSGLIYEVAGDFNNCSNLIDDTLPVSSNFSIRTTCAGEGANAFIGNGYFDIIINTSSTPNNGLVCDGNVNEVIMLNNTLSIQSFGLFRCISSGPLSVNGTGVVEDDELLCSVANSTIMPTNTFSATSTLPPTTLPDSTIMPTNTFSVTSTLPPTTPPTTSAALPTETPTDNVTVPTEIPTTNAPTEIPTSSLIKYCTGSGNFSLIGEGAYNVNIQNGNVSCFGAIIANTITFTNGAFSCNGSGNFVLNGSGLLYSVTASGFNNCTSLTDGISNIHGNTSVRTVCTGSGANAFLGNGYFNVVVNTSLPNSGLACLGVVSENSVSTDTISTETFGLFRCIASGYVSINGTGIIEDDELFCSVSPISTGEPLECSGVGQFEIIGSGFFDIMAIPEITCIGAGESLTVDMGESFMSRGSFVCNGSEFFTLNGTGEIQSVITVLGGHNCTDMMMPISGSGVTATVTCSGEGDYVIVGDGDFYINRNGPGLLQCSGEVISGVNTSSRAEYFTNGDFNCIVTGIVYFTGMGRAEVVNASASYECDGVFFPGPTEEPPFSGFDGDEITCFADGEYVIVGNGQIQLAAQSSTPFSCQGAIVPDLDQNTAVSTGDFMCTGNGFVQLTGRGEVFVNSTRFNNCTRGDTVISNIRLLCSGYGDYEIFGFANATIFASDELSCNGEVFPLATSGPGSYYYVGGYYRCTSNGLFNITGIGNATFVNTTIDTDGRNVYSCLDPLLLTCASFAFGGSADESISLTGDGEFTIVGDKELSCTGNAVLCPGEINYYFTDGYFYCSSNVFTYINGTGMIENITGVNNCSGFGFGIPPIISGTPLTPQPSCIGFGNQYQINGSGSFNASRLTGSLNCNVTFQEPDSDVYIFSSNQEPFNCNGNGIFMFEGTGNSTIILNDGYFNCVDLIPSTSVTTTPTVTTSVSVSTMVTVNTTPILMTSVSGNISTMVTSVSTSVPRVSTLVPSVSTSVPSVSTFISSVSTPATSALTSFATTVPTSVPSVSTSVPSVSTSVPSASTFISSVSTPATSALTSFATTVPTTMPTSVPSVSTSVPSVSTSVPSVSTSVPSVSTSVPSASTFISSVSTPATSALTSFATTVPTSLPSVSTSVPSVSTSVPSVSTFISSVSTPATSALTSFATTVPTSVPSVSTSVPSVSTSVPSVSTFISSVSTPATSALTSFATTVPTTMPTSVPSVSTSVPSVSTSVPSVSTSVPSVSTSVPVNLHI